MLRRSGPEDQAVPLVSETGFDLRVRQSQEDLVDDEPLEVWCQELGLLLRVALGPVGLVESADLFLGRYIESAAVADV